MLVKQRIECLRKWLNDNGFAACVIPQSDPHLSEYLESYDEVRAYFSGFTGSAGTLVVTAMLAGLWTDSRYFIQAEEQLRYTGIMLFKQGVAGTPSVKEWLAQQLTAGGRVAANALLFSAEDWQAMESVLAMRHCSGFEHCWQERPPLSCRSAALMDEKLAGCSAVDKIAQLREQLCEKNVTACFVSSLDDIAWLLNIRGADMEYVPVVRSYLWLDKERIYWWVDERKIPLDVRAYLEVLSVQVLPYEALSETLPTYTDACSVWVDLTVLNARVHQLLAEKYTLTALPLWITGAKAVKNAVELQGFRDAAQQDGVAWVRMLKWLQENEQRASITEMGFAHQLVAYKKMNPLYRGESFAPIVAFGEHGAIVHYEATPQSDVRIAKNGFLLVDAGSHYVFGTTDTTRTLVVGEVTEEQRRCYTWVLKGMIALATACFDPTTPAADLDKMVRDCLRQGGLDYGHGTGHGIGHVLSVHEKGATISPRNSKPLQVGMVLSDEPGYYRAGEFGIRLENMLSVKVLSSELYAFETLTLIPFDKRAICVELLSSDERAWINHYHATVRKKLQVFLSDEEYNWLSNYTYEM